MTVGEFLSQKRIAVVGVRRSGSAAPGNAIYKKLRDAGYEVFAVNPNAEQAEGDVCYPDVASIPGEVEGAVICTRPETAETIVEQCKRKGISRVWLHRSFGQGSVSEKAVQYCRENGIEAIAGGCPMMYCEPVDFGHRCMRWMLRLGGKVPQ